MKRTAAVPPQYLQISLDLAQRIADGSLPEGAVVYGRSVMSSQYSVSPETIRRALHLLSDMKVVEITPKSGAVVLSADSARRYIANFQGSADTRRLREDLRNMLAEYADLSRRMTETVSAIIQARETFTAAKEPFPNYEIAVPPRSPIIGKSVGWLKFWQSTGGTIVAIRRGQNVILSPGPYAQLYAGDVIILVGSESAAAAAARFVAEKEVLDDTV